MARNILVGTVCLLAFAVGAGRADDILLDVRNVPAHGVAIASVDLTAAVQWRGMKQLDPDRIQVTIVATGRDVPAQLVVDPDFDARERIVGLLVAQLPRGGDWQLRLTTDGDVARKPTDWSGIIETPFYRIEHKANRMGGLPSRIEFPQSGKVFDSLRWNDRCYDLAAGGCYLRDDPQPRIELLSQGPVGTAVRTAAEYRYSAGNRPASHPHATYTWIYLHRLPLIYVVGEIEQTTAVQWKEVHFLELNFPGKPFAQWAGEDPPAHGMFNDSGSSHRFSKWGLMHDGTNVIGMIQAGQVLLYDGKDGYGKYLHARGNQAWQAWAGLAQRRSAWLWIGSADSPEAAVRQAAVQLPGKVQLSVSVAPVETAIAAARKGTQSPASWWRVAAAEQLRAQGLYRPAIAAASGRLPDSLATLTAGKLGMLVQRAETGIRLLSLFDMGTGTQLSAAKSLPLFELTLRDAATKDEVKVLADGGWGSVALAQTQNKLAMRWADPNDRRLSGLSVTARATASMDSDSIAWSLEVQGQPAPWSVWEVTCPQLAAAQLGGDATLLLPQGSGTLKPIAQNRGLRSRSRYPSGWTSMQFMALYDAAAKTGLYVAMHDPWGSTKTLIAEIGTPDQGVTLGFAHPVPGMGRAGNRFTMCGSGEWRLFRGDWFDAALIYRNWVRQHARWYPKLTSDGRADTPLWMRELCCWAMGGEEPAKFAELNKRLQQFLEVPLGVHWYRWHQIPFDNDYPHYFPTVPGFTDAVADLQRNNVFVMPYINGRLWDTHDHGADDAEFSKIALPAATKDEDGKPYIEMYGSKESDGQRVRLAVMCPATEIWQSKVQEIVLRLMNECGVCGVYIDQIAAAQPRLCFDTRHHHPLGGGHWWTESYWQLLQAIRRQMPADRMLTTECNAEPYIHCFDGYLTWHWQFDGQVPAFPAVYGGAIQMFGRAYRGGPTKDLAFRMKAGQQLVFGEQIGWMNPAVVDESENATFLRQIAQTRQQYRRFFYAGEMARPPKLVGAVPKVTADWQWQGVWPVTTAAVMTGGWRITGEHRALLVFVNVSDQPVAATVRLNLRDYLPDANRVRVLDHSQSGELLLDPETVLQRDLQIDKRSVLVWELEGA